MTFEEAIEELHRAGYKLSTLWEASDGYYAIVIKAGAPAGRAFSAPSPASAILAALKAAIGS